MNICRYRLRSVWHKPYPHLPLLHPLADLTVSYDKLRAASARIVAIANPPSPRFLAAAQVEATHLPFPTLIDAGMKVAVAYGVTYSLPAQNAHKVVARR
jgi:peroxiredoxin